MEGEIHYSTVVFKNSGPSPKEKKEELAVYSEVKPKDPATTAPEKKEDPAIDSKVKPKDPATTAPTDGEAAAHSHVCVLAVCLGIVCVLLVASISAIIWISVVLNEQRASLSILTAENQQLITEKDNLKSETEELSKLKDNLNWTLEVILTFRIFPVHKYCPAKKCQPCLKDWILFQDKCYLFSDKPTSWKTWGKSRKYCQNTSADLVVINSLEEQKFVTHHIKYYYDKYHGYWIGLRETEEKTWQWVDGRNVTLKFWMKEDGGSDPCALTIPGQNLETYNWRRPGCAMQNKFICESEALIRSN